MLGSGRLLKARICGACAQVYQRPVTLYDESGAQIELVLWPDFHADGDTLARVRACTLPKGSAVL